MNNKKLGTEFEKEICEILKQSGWWVHFIEPKQSGAQPFDIIAVKNGRALAMDCKTCVSGSFSINRLEDNQIYAFNKWIDCGNGMPYVVVQHNEKIYMLPYTFIVERQTVKLEECEKLEWKL